MQALIDLATGPWKEASSPAALELFLPWGSCKNGLVRDHLSQIGALGASWSSVTLI